MKPDGRVALIHATRIAIDPIVNAFKNDWPDVEHVSLLDEALAIDRNKDSELSADLSKRIIALAHYAEDLNARGILYTCSAFGPAIEAATQSCQIPVLKPNEAMFEQALKLGKRITMVYTFDPAVAGMEQEFKEEVNKQNISAQLQVAYADGARVALERGDEETHNQIIAQTAAEVENADVILLAHFSMARAAEIARSMTKLPVLCCPESAVAKLKSLVLQKDTQAETC